MIRIVLEYSATRHEFCMFPTAPRGRVELVYRGAVGNRVVGIGRAVVHNAPLATSRRTEGKMLKLYTFRMSTFSEKVRWALDLEGLSYRELALLPGLHLHTTKRLAPRSSVPLLVDETTENGQLTGCRVVQGSADILDHIAETRGLSSLAVGEFQVARVVELEALADTKLGPALQTLAYDSLLKERRITTAVWSHSGPFWAKMFYGLTYRKISKVVQFAYCGSPERVEAAAATLLETLKATDASLQGEKYLVGSRLSRADIAVAALLAPLINSPQFPVQWPEWTGTLGELSRQLQDSATLQFATRLYAQERRRLG